MWLICLPPYRPPPSPLVIASSSVYAVLGHPFAYGNATFDDATVSEENAKLQPFTTQGIFRHLFASGLLRGNVIKHMQGGLAGIPQGLKYMQEGKVRAPASQMSRLLSSKSKTS